MGQILVPPFTEETARQKVRLAEDLWNSRDPSRVVGAYTADSVWRNRSEFLEGHQQIAAFLERKWQHELEYRLIKELWAVTGARIAVRYACEWHDGAGQWFRSYGNEDWEFDTAGLMKQRFASVNDVLLEEGERRFHWELGPRPAGIPGLTELGL